MKFVKYKLDKVWWFEKFPKETCENKVTKHNYYLFPYFIYDDFSTGFVLNEDTYEWVNEFRFITKKTYLKHTNFNEKELDLVIELLESKGWNNKLIALEIYKKKLKQNGKIKEKME